MDAFEKGSCIPYLGYKHFVTRRITLIRYMLNKFKIEFKEFFFSYFFTEISHSCFSMIFVKVQIVIVSLKQYKKTSLVIIFSERKKHAFLLNLHNCQLILRATVNLIYSNMKWGFLYTEVISTSTILIQSYFFFISEPDSNYFLNA